MEQETPQIIGVDREYFEKLIDNLALGLFPSANIKSLVSDHPTLIGMYTEAVLRDFIADVVSPARVSTGAVVYPGQDRRARPKQIDLIVWSPNPFPPIFRAANFALVPRMSSLGIIEIKHSTYSGVGMEIQSFLDLESELTIGQREIPAAMGVILRQEKPISDTVLQRQVEDGKTVILINAMDTPPKPNFRGICKLVNFLSGLRLRLKRSDGLVRVNEEVVAPAG